jgi:hypothetical protein
LIKIAEDKEEEEKEFIENNGRELFKKITYVLETYLPIYTNLLREALEPKIEGYLLDDKK